MMEKDDIFMMLGCAVCLPGATAAYELGHLYIGAALCIASGACMLLAAKCWTSPNRDTEKWR